MMVFPVNRVFRKIDQGIMHPAHIPFHAKTKTTAIHWPTVLGKQYAIERSTTLFSGSWTAIATNTGTGGDMEFDDANTGKVKFYRVRILP